MKLMKAELITFGFASLMLLASDSIAAPFGTGFTYQGRLANGTNVANGYYDLKFSLFDGLSGGNQVGVSQTNIATAVSNGVFTVALDFGAIFDGNARWLEIGVRTNGPGTFTTLSPRQALTPTPYAVTASNLSGTLPAAQLSGTLPSGALGGTYNGVLTFNNGLNTFVGSGAGLSGVNAATLGGYGYCSLPCYWNLTGNGGTTPGLNFLGTTDNNALELKVNNQRAFRLEPTTNAPNVIGGYVGNYVFTNAFGVTIGGGGALGATNFADLVLPLFSPDQFPNFGVIAGGAGNRLLGGSYGAIGGGQGNSIFSKWGNNVVCGGGYNAVFWGRDSIIAGGSSNSISGDTSTFVAEGSVIGGGLKNLIATGIQDIQFSTIAGGTYNEIFLSSAASIGGGTTNVISHGSDSSTISGGAQNFMGSSPSGTIGGGQGNDIETSPSATIAGGASNRISDFSTNAVISGGSNNTNSGIYGTITGGYSNTNGGAYGSINGGAMNLIQGNYASVGGGQGNAIYTDGISTDNTNNVIAGGGFNVMFLGRGSVISGGLSNQIQGDFSRIPIISSVIAGGQQNLIYTFADQMAYSAISGGFDNFISHTTGATIGGGATNTIAHSSHYATIAGGSGNIVDFQSSGSIGGGQGNQVYNNYGTIPGGLQAQASNFGQMAYASGQFAAPGDAQTSVFVCRGVTTTGTQTELFLDGSSQRIAVPLNATWTFDVMISGRTSTGSSAAYRIFGAIKNVANTTTLLGALNKTVIGEDVAAWDATVVADDTNDALEVRVTGASGTTIRWVASVRTSEVSF
jgi:hypothetical protein